MLVHDHPVPVHDEGLRHPVDPELDARAPLAVTPDQRIGIAKLDQEGPRVLGRILVVDAVDGHTFRRQRLDLWVFGPAGAAPTGPDVHQFHSRSGQVRPAEIGLVRMQRGQRELGCGIADQRRGQALDVRVEQPHRQRRQDRNRPG